MKAIERLFGIINLVYTLLFIVFILKYATAILGVIGSSLGILITLLPIVIGSAFSFNHLIKKTKGLHIVDKILNVFALINLTILLLFFLLSLIN